MRAGIYPAKQKTDPTFAVSNPDGYERKREQCSDDRNPANGSRNAPRDTPSETAAEYVGPKAYSLNSTNMSIKGSSVWAKRSVIWKKIESQYGVIFAALPIKKTLS